MIQALPLIEPDCGWKKQPQGEYRHRNAFQKAPIRAFIASCKKEPAIAKLAVAGAETDRRTHQPWHCQENQQQACQENRTLDVNTGFKVDNYITGKVTGSLDTAEFLDIKYINDLNLETPNLMTTFAGSFKDKEAGKPWRGSFEYQDSLGGTTLSAAKGNCKVEYTLSDRSNFSTYALDYKLGAMALDITGNGTQKTVTWKNPANTKLVLVSQIDVNKSETGANGYVQNVVFSNNEKQFTPVIPDHSTNYAIVVQAFDANNKLIGYQALIQDLPESL